ncbi:hypothetical protein O0L34_g7908 [Tuta absoluta]|nr:hypothetical protein O0L34_g7908 [Tuta absoluta]
MELVSFAKNVIQNLAEQAASYRIGQTALRYADRALWVVEKCARWAVPPPLDADERPEPELVRPLPWIFFLTMLVTLRITRECISLINLILGKPPLRSADVVMYIQSKRRYLRTLKYQGNRHQRARRAPSAEPWYSGFKALFEFTMCFRRSHHYGNNNTTRVSNNDEVLVVKRSKRARDTANPAASTADTPMERLIEKMMGELGADSDDDSSYTLTNATSLRSLRSEGSEFDQDNTLDIDNNITLDTSVTSDDTTIANHHQSPEPTEVSVATSTPEKNGETEIEIEKTKPENGTHHDVPAGKIALSEPDHVETEQNSPKTDSPNDKKTKYSPKETTNNFLQSEKCQQKQPKQTKFGRKISLAFSKIFSIEKHEATEALANGRAMSVPNKKKGINSRTHFATLISSVLR